MSAFEPFRTLNEGAADPPELCRRGAGEGGHTPIFVTAGSAYLVALLVVHLINRRYEPVTKFAEPAA